MDGAGPSLRGELCTLQGAAWAAFASAQSGCAHADWAGHAASDTPGGPTAGGAAGGSADTDAVAAVGEELLSDNDRRQLRRLRKRLRQIDRVSIKQFGQLNAQEHEKLSLSAVSNTQHPLQKKRIV